MAVLESHQAEVQAEEEMKVKFVLLLVLTYVVSEYLLQLTRMPLLYALVTLPGTFFHELAHYGFALLMNGDPQGFSLIPEVRENTIELGSVLFRPSATNAATVAFAPFLLMPLTGYFVALSLQTKTLLRQGLCLYGACCTWNSCVPSEPDFQIAFSEPTSIPIAAFLIGLGFILTFMVLRRMLRTVQ